jgi:hypothetical protein
VTVTDLTGLSNSVVFSLTVAAPLLTISANPTSLTIAQGSSGETTLTFTPTGGYNGTLTLSCTGLPANSLCTFTLNGASISSLTLPGNNLPVSVLLTIETDVNAQQARMEPRPTPLRPGAILTAIAFWWPGTLLGLFALRRKRKLFTKDRGWLGLCLCALLIGTLASLAGCNHGGGHGAYVTPVGNSTVTITVTPGAGSGQTLSLGVTITKQ